MTKLESIRKLLCDEIMKQPTSVINCLGASYTEMHGFKYGQFDKLIRWIKQLSDNS